MKAVDGPTHETAAGTVVERTAKVDVAPTTRARPLRRVMNGPAMVRLQRSAGNSAVVGLVSSRNTEGTKSTPVAAGAGPSVGVEAPTGPPLVQRLAGGGACPPEPVPPPPASPEQDPKFGKVHNDVTSKAKTLKAHPTSASEAKKAGAAAQAPAGDKESQAQAAQADKMAGAKPGVFDKAAFIAAVKTAIAAQAPKNLDEADKFASSGKSDAVKSQVMGKVATGKDASAKDIDDKAKETPDASKGKDKPVVPLKDVPGPKPAPPKGAAAMPSKAPAEQTELGAGKCGTDSKMAEADVSEAQLAKSNEPDFSDALVAKKEGEAHSATAPAEARQAEAATLQSAGAEADSSATGAMAAMLGAKGRASTKTGADKAAAKAKDELARAAVVKEIKRIFDTTKTDVDKILTDLDGLVAKRFEDGEKGAKDAFTADHKARMERYKDDRYSGVTGWARWTADLFTGMPAEANNIFLESKKLYESRMEKVISDVADVIGKELTRAKDRIAQGRAEIAKFVASQPKELQTVAKEAATEIGSQFEQLESDVDDKQQSLVDDLAQKYVEARSAVDDEIAALQAENKGLWDKAKDAIGGVIQTILKLKDMLLGVLARAAGAVGKIIKDPIGFLGNFVSAVKAGIEGFGKNILKHLKEGLQKWLFGALADTGIELPDTLDLKGVIKLILSILGLTWTRIRTRLVKKVGETAMKALETGVEIFQLLVAEGPAGLLKWLVGQLSDLKDQVMAAIEDFVVVKVIKAGITWLISMLNPAAAFIKACKMIYDVVMFFVEKGSQIKEFVDSVLDSVESIVSGGVGKVASLIEGTLAKILPLVIGFIASLLGLGGISEKVKEILEKVQKPVTKAVDKIINGALKAGKGLLKKLGIGKKKKDVGAGDANHEQIASSVAKELSQPIKSAETVDGEALHRSKVEQAKTLKARYGSRLQSGIGLTINVAEAKHTNGHDELEFDVVIAPNTTRKAGTVTTEGGAPKKGDHVFAHGLATDVRTLRSAAAAKLGDAPEGRRIITALEQCAAILSGDVYSLTVEKGRPPAAGDAHSQAFGQHSAKLHTAMTAYITAIAERRRQPASRENAQFFAGAVRNAAAIVSLRIGDWIANAVDADAAALVPEKRAQVARGRAGLVQLQGLIERALEAGLNE